MAVKAASLGDEPPRGVFSALALAGACAVLIGTVVQFVILGLGGAGQGGLIVIFDWMLAPVWGLVLVVAGRWAARRALRSGRFGPVACVVFGIVLVIAVSLGCSALFLGLPPAPEIYGPVLYSLHLGMVYGSLAGFLFWRIMTGREPRLLPRSAPRHRRAATLVFAGLMCVYMVLLTLYFLTLMEPHKTLPALA